jgi:magnesium-transporting ATPase (P-type)
MDAGANDVSMIQMADVGVGIGFCNGAVSVFEPFTFSTWSLELSTTRLYGSLQLLS